jgi:hypothetical protein
MTCLAVLLFVACTSRKVTNNVGLAHAWEVKKVAAYRKGDLRYDLFLKKYNNVHNKRNVDFVLRIINIENDVSPLRAISKNLDEYSVHYEYLLNQAKDDFALYVDGKSLFPLSYSFENYYNTFPFDALNIGFASGTKLQGKNAELVFVDRLFSRDSIFFNIKIN